jgi:lysozyme
MTITSRLSQALSLVKAFETFHARAAPQTDGGFVIGYGHTVSAREGAVVSRKEAEALLIYDLGEMGRLIDGWVYAPLHDNQRQALIAFGFHIGADDLHASTAMRRLNAGDYMGCAREIERWRMADLAGRGQVVDALVRRRAAEKALFLTPPEGFPKPVGARLKPRFDGERVAPAPAGGQAPVETPGEPATASMTAAHNVAARLRALMPDPEPASQTPPEPPELQPAPPSPEAVEALETHHRPAPPEDAPNRDMAAAPAAPVSNGRTESVADVAPQEPPPPIWSPREEPPPPPFVPALRSREPTLRSANDVSPPQMAPEPSRSDDLGEIAPAAEWGAPAEEPDGVDPAIRWAWRDRLAAVSATLLRRGHLILGVIGVVLFMISVVAILTGKPSAWNLGLGLVGVLCMTPAAYGLLGRNRPS